MRSIHNKHNRRYNLLSVLKSTNLHFAMASGNAEIVKILIMSGARTSLRDRLGFDIASYAAKFSRTQCLQTFLNLREKEFKMQMASKDYLQLCMGSNNSDFKCIKECIEFLLSQGQDICKSHHDSGLTLLMQTVSSVNTCSVESINFVIEAVHQRSGIPISDIVNERCYPKTILWTFLKQYTNVSSMLRLGHLSDPKKNPAMHSMQLMWGTTALHYAFGSGNVFVAYRLIELGADINAKNDLGMSVMDFASGFGHREVMAKVLDDTVCIEKKK